MRSGLRWVVSGFLGCGCLSFMASAHADVCTNESLQRIFDRGVVTVGVKADYKPWSFRNVDGDLVGLEVDMARRVADTLGVALEAVPVASSNRMQFLREGKIDVLIATLSDRADRRESIGIVQPNYYTSGTNILTSATHGFTQWEELRGRKICGKQGAFYNRIVEERYGAEIVAFPGNAEAKQALRDGACIAWVFDDASIISDLSSGEWDGFEMPLPSEDNNPWALAVAHEERECVLGQMMSGLQYNWLQTGELIELEKRWGIQSNRFLIEQKERFRDWMAR